MMNVSFFQEDGVGGRAHIVGPSQEDLGLSEEHTICDRYDQVLQSVQLGNMQIRYLRG